MNNIQLTLNANNRGAFFIEENGERVAEMEIAVSDKHLTVFHTEVFEKLRGQGVAKKLLDTMVDYARQHHLKVIPLCPYTSVTFKRHPELYEDVWEKNFRVKE